MFPLYLPVILSPKLGIMLYSLEQLQQMVEKALQDLDYGRRMPPGLYEPVGYIVSIGGKRIRPVMLLMAANLFSDEIKHALMPSLAIEVFHNFTLLHDDIMDDAPIRRNHPAVHVKWNQNTAILSGDVMSVLAFQYLTETKQELIHRILPVFTRAAMEVCEGQQMDIDFETMTMVTEEEYIRMIEKKTSVLLAASFKIGALLGGANEKQSDLLYETGLNLGLAFQVQDDFLDSFGDQDTFGKFIGGDILMNKKTFLMVKALEIAEGSDAAELKILISSRDTDPAIKIQKVRDLYIRTGAKQKAEEKIKYYFDLALSRLEMIPVKPERKKEILCLANLLISRKY